ncbi:MAG TPA: response regulator transcription factor [Leptospiraceae bacterium]|nr:response regulator transcription factor [Leptospiraceae bacterium]HMW06747.1 response regulator transcription factor [Leptospiraceae bacterium]HMX33700.1 response regulator transcription factor [Leptospiraceae bacterium]HMY32053.1 response regulator transcription factor [Leptospiraceae bacterium]HMZ63976.1 response regulator transcription factor [Leptospiraceae bacterium]
MVHFEKTQKNSTPWRIVVADDHSVAHFGIEAVLAANPEFTIVSKISDGRQIKITLQQEEADILILDVDLPELSGIDFLREERSNFPNLKILLFTVHEGEGFFREALRLGANGYFLKSDHILNMPKALSCLVKNEFYCSEKIKSYLLKTEKSDELSSKEIEILKMVVAGFSAREIGERMEISRRTIEYYITRLKEKLDAENIVELVVTAKEKYFL